MTTRPTAEAKSGPYIFDMNRRAHPHLLLMEQHQEAQLDLLPKLALAGVLATAGLVTYEALKHIVHIGSEHVG